MKLIRISLVNWYLFNPIDLNIKGNTAIIGINGTGKSTILDAVQTVLFGANMNHIRLNAKASPSSSKSARNLKSYCLGAYLPEGDNGAPLTVRQDAETYLALTFEGNNKTINLFLALEARYDEPSAEVKLLAIGKGDRPLSCEDFISRKPDGTYTVIGIESIQEALHLKSMRFKFCHNAKEYIDEMAMELGPDRLSGESITPEVLSRTMSKSLSLGEIKSVSGFVKSFILESNPLKVQSVINARNEYRQILKQIEDDERKLRELQPIARKLKSALKLKRKSVSLYWLFFEEQYGQMELDLESLQEQRESAVTGYLNNKQSIKTLTMEMAALQLKIRNLNQLINSSNSKVEYDRLTGKIEKLLAELEQLKKNKKALVSVLANFAEQPFAYLLGSEVDVSELEALSKLMANPDKLNPQKIDKHLTNLPELVNRINSVADDSKFNLNERLQTVKTRLQELHDLIATAQKGEISLEKRTQLVIAALSQEGITATPLCNLATVTDKRWQPAIESILGSKTEALIVDPEDELRAYQVYRQMRHKHGANIYNVSIVRTSKANDWLNRYKENSAATIVESDNELVLAFLHNQLGDFIMVESEHELKQHPRAITVDGMLSTPAITTRNRLPTTLKLVADQTENISVWEAEQTSLNTERTNSESKINKIKSLYDESVRFKGFLDRLESLSFSQIESQLESLGNIIKSTTQEREQIDLTSIEENQKKMDAYQEDWDNKDRESKKCTRNQGGIISQALNTKRNFLKSKNIEMPAVQSAQQEMAKDPEFNIQLTDEISMEVEGVEPSVIREQAETAANEYEKRFNDSMMDLRLYLNNIDFFIEQGESLTIDNIVRVNQLVSSQLDSIEKDSLAHHIESAKRAEREMNDSFRSDMINKLKGAFDEMSNQFRSINNSLRKKQFHGKTYAFRAYKKPEFEALINYIEETSEDEADNVGDLFDNTPEEVKQDIDHLINGESEGVSVLEDYRQYFEYDVEIADISTGQKTKLSKLNDSGSGGERQAPFYVTIASSLASAWKTLKKPEESVGLTLLDEAFNNLSEDNLISAKQFMNEVGLQMIIAAPSDKEPAFRTVMDSFIYISREGQAVAVDIDYITDKGRSILVDANPNLNPSIVSKQMANNGL